MSLSLQQSDQALPDPIQILDVQVHPLTVDQLNHQIKCYVMQKAHALVLNVNVNCLCLAQEHRWLRDLLNGAELVFCDGAGVILGARLLGYHIPMRITYADWIWQLAAYASEHNLTMFFLGGLPGIAARAALRLQERFPNLQVSGTHHGYFNKEPDGKENLEVIEAVNAARPDILLVAFGMPLQEKWLRDNWQLLNAQVALAGGAVFDYVSGELRRAPAWMNDRGLEWLGRLVIEPGRLWRRYLLGNPVFLAHVLRQRCKGPS